MTEDMEQWRRKIEEEESNDNKNNKTKNKKKTVQTKTANKIFDILHILFFNSVSYTKWERCHITFG